MNDHFRYDPAKYHERVSNIAEHVVASHDAIPTIAPRCDFDENSYHQAATQKAEQDQLSKRYPRLYR